MDQHMWHYLSGEEQIGPVSQEDLKRLLAEGALPQDTYAWTEGMTDWLPASQIPVLGGTAAPPAFPPAGQTRPIPVTVFGILNIVFGGLTLLCSPLAIIGLLVPQPHGGIEFGPGMKVYMLISYAAGIGMAGLLLAAGIALLNQKRWGRKISFWYGWVAIVWGIIAITINLILFLPQLGTTSSEMMPAAIGGMCGGIFGLIYPILLVIFMQRPNVIQACQK